MTDRQSPPLPIPVMVVTSAGLHPGRTHLDVGLAGLEGGANGVQLRGRELDEERLHATARALASACERHGVPLIVNDRIDVAVACSAAGAHLGQGDPLDDARSRLGPDLLLGISVETPAQAVAAVRLGADYLGVTIWETATKPEARVVGLDGLEATVAATDLPVIAIGGISADNAPHALGAGAAGIAVVSAVGAADDPVAATRRLVRAVEQARSRR